MELSDFLDIVITSPEEGFFCFASGGPNVGGWSERWYRWPAQKQDILDAVERARGTSNVYFSTYLFNSSSSMKSNVLPTRTIQADLDEADISDLPLEPTVLVRTSPGRHQAYWVLKDALPPETHELLSRKLTYAIQKCDHSGWPLGRKIRMPETFNFKYLDGPKPIEVIASSRKTYPVDAFEMLPEASSATETSDQEHWLENVHTLALDIAPLELLESIRTKGLSAKAYLLYSSPATDRSATLWALMLQAFRCGLDRDAVYWLALHSKNNKFADLRFHGERELAKDVLRAEATVRKSGSDPREVINQSRRLAPASIRKQTILSQVTQFMRERGSFLHAMDDSLWYVRRDIGRPVLVGESSDYLDALLDVEYGLNKTEVEHNYAAAGLVSYTRNSAINAWKSALSYYDPDNQSLMLHMGRKDVLRVSPSGLDTIIDGAHGVIFPWQSSVEAFTLGTPDPDWAQSLFGLSAGRDALHNVIGMTPAQVKALLRVWFLFILFRNIAVSRPLLATFGQPGSGKSTLFKKIYALIYGRHKAIGSVTKEDDFDHAVASDPLVVLDNVDSWKEWLPDRLALSAGTSDITKRKLYTDADTVVLKRQALVGITAHNPRFGREDVADRLLLLTYERLTEFAPEQVIIDNVIAQRSRLWGGIVQDVQKIIITPIPAVGPQFRVEDFARLGLWISRALGIENEFVSAIGNIRTGQRSFSLDEDRMLVDALTRLTASKGRLERKTAGQLWGLLEGGGVAADPVAFSRTYRSSIALGKKLLNLQDSLKTMFDITWVVDDDLGKLWTIGPQIDPLKEALNGTRIEGDTRNGSSGGVVAPEAPGVGGR